MSFSDGAMARMTEARRAFLHLLDSDPDMVIYGVTSGYGQRANVRFTLEERRRHAARPPRTAASAFGAPFPLRVTRGIVFARLANFVEGHAAISPDLAQAVAAMLASDDIPAVPREGHGGAGEILALSHLFLPVAESATLGEKDTLSLINGSPCAAALLADAALSSRRRVRIATEIFALSAEAFLAPLDHYDDALDALWDDPEESEALQALRALLAGGGAERRPYQAPVSFRIVPRLLGRVIRAVKAAEQMASRSLRSITDNPVFLMPSAEHPLGRALSTGGYRNAAAAAALDELAACYADLALLAERQTARILEGRVSRLPDQLERVRHRQNQKGDSQGSQKVIQAMRWVKGGQPWMTRPYSEDLRERVVRVVESGTSRNAAAKQFDVSISFVVKLMQRWKQRGTIKADKYGGWKKSKLAPHGDRIRALVMENCDITIDELCVLLAAEGIEAKRSTLGDFLLAQGLSRKKRQPTPPSRSALTSRRREPLGATSNLG